MKKIIKNLEKLKKNSEIMWKMPLKTRLFVHFKPQIKKKWKPGYPGFEVKKPDPPKGPKTRVPRFPGTRVPNTKIKLNIFITYLV